MRRTMLLSVWWLVVMWTCFLDTSVLLLLDFLSGLVVSFDDEVEMIFDKHLLGKQICPNIRVYFRPPCQTERVKKPKWRVTLACSGAFWTLFPVAWAVRRPSVDLLERKSSFCQPQSSLLFHLSCRCLLVCLRLQRRRLPLPWRCWYFALLLLEACQLRGKKKPMINCDDDDDDGGDDCSLSPFTVSHFLWRTLEICSCRKAGGTQ